MVAPFPPSRRWEVRQKERRKSATMMRELRNIPTDPQEEDEDGGRLGQVGVHERQVVGRHLRIDPPQEKNRAFRRTEAWVVSIVKKKGERESAEP